MAGSCQSDVFYVTSALGSAVTAYGLGRSECGSRRMYVHVHVSIAVWQIMQGCVLFAQGDADAMKKATIYVDEDEPQQGTHLRHDVTMRSGKHA